MAHFLNRLIDIFSTVVIVYVLLTSASIGYQTAVGYKEDMENIVQQQSEAIRDYLPEDMLKTFNIDNI